MKEKMKILVAYDGSECAEAALEDLRHAGLETESEVLDVSGRRFCAAANQ